MDLRKAAVPAAILFGGAILAGCGDTTTGDPATDTDPNMDVEQPMDPTNEPMDPTVEPTQ